MNGDASPKQRSQHHSDGRIVHDGIPATAPSNRRWLSFVEATLLATLVLGPALAVAVALDLRHGNMAEWVSAIATVAAFSAAVAAARYAAGAYRIEQVRERRMDDALLKEQASRVAGWTLPILKVTYHPHGKHEEVSAIKIWLRNASDVPVTQLVLAVYVVRQTGQPGSRMLVTRVFEERLGVLPPDAAPMEIVVADPRALAAATEAWNLGLPSTPELRVRIEFQDASSNWWLRTSSGVLSAIYAPTILA